MLRIITIWAILAIGSYMADNRRRSTSNPIRFALSVYQSRNPRRRMFAASSAASWELLRVMVICENHLPPHISAVTDAILVRLVYGWYILPAFAFSRCGCILIPSKVHTIAQIWALPYVRIRGESFYGIITRELAIKCLLAAHWPSNMVSWSLKTSIFLSVFMELTVLAVLAVIFPTFSLHLYTTTVIDTYKNSN